MIGAIAGDIAGSRFNSEGGLFPLEKSGVMWRLMRCFDDVL